MTQADLGVALMIALLVLGFTLLQARRIHRERIKIARYKLFAARDLMIRLVADGAIREADPVFQFLYDEINSLIPKAKPLSLRALVKALDESRIVNDESFREKCKQAVSHDNAALRQAANAFFAAVIEILVMRSFMVRISFQLTHSGLTLWSWCRDCLSVLRRVASAFFPTQTEAYRLYKGIERLEHPL